MEADLPYLYYKCLRLIRAEKAIYELISSVVKTLNFPYMSITNMQIAENLVALIHYTLKDEQGNLLDSSEGQEPLPFLCGAHNIVEGLEKALIGKTVGDKLDVVVKPEEGYGEVRAELVQKVARENFQGIDDIQVGMQFMAEAPWGQQPVTVTAIEDDGVMLDGNHPLAGQILQFSVEVTEVREATDDEIAHGHVHGEGCDHDH